MDKLRLGMESISKGRVDDPEFLRDNLQDLLALAAFGLAGLLSLGLTGGGTQATSWALQALGLDDAPGLFLLTARSEEHTAELQSRQYLVCRLLLEKKIKD